MGTITSRFLWLLAGFAAVFGVGTLVVCVAVATHPASLPGSENEEWNR